MHPQAGQSRTGKNSLAQLKSNAHNNVINNARNNADDENDDDDDNLTGAPCLLLAALPL